MDVILVLMRTQEFENIIVTENKARLYFRKYCWQKRHIFCTQCRSYKIYRIAGKRYRCRRCHYTFHDFTGRWINKLHCSFKTWLWLIKLFELEISALRAAVQCGISYPTALKAYDLLRYSILVSSQDAQWMVRLNWTRATLAADARASGVAEPPVKCLCLAFWSETA